jgi:hypothetical protein
MFQIFDAFGNHDLYQVLPSRDGRRADSSSFAVRIAVNRGDDLVEGASDEDEATTGSSAAKFLSGGRRIYAGPSSNRSVIYGVLFAPMIAADFRIWTMSTHRIDENLWHDVN